MFVDKAKSRFDDRGTFVRTTECGCRWGGSRRQFHLKLFRLSVNVTATTMTSVFRHPQQNRVNLTPIKGMNRPAAAQSVAVQVDEAM